AMFINKHLAHEEPQEAANGLQELKKLQPHSFLTLELDSHVHAMWGVRPPNEIIESIKEFVARKDSEPSERFAKSAQLLVDLYASYPSLKEKEPTFFAKAKKWLETLSEAMGERESRLVLAGFLGGIQELADCLTICESVRSDLVRAGNATDRDELHVA